MNTFCSVKDPYERRTQNIIALKTVPKDTVVEVEEFNLRQEWKFKNEDLFMNEFLLRMKNQERRFCYDLSTALTHLNLYTTNTKGN